MFTNSSYVNERDRFKYGGFIPGKFFCFTNRNTNLKS